jgi:regulator of protease activity HflC (stomatin/prohibitin superfamily)
MINFDISWAIALAIVIGLVAKGVKIVPQQQAWVIERLGKFNSVLQAGLNFIIPFVDRVAYKHTLKEDAMDVKQQAAITNDNVTLLIDGLLYVKIIDPMAASYGISDPYYAIMQLAQTTMRSEIGKLPMDRTFEERTTLNTNIVSVINEAAESWGIQCMRYEIRDIQPPATVLKAMELQVAAERQKRALILESEGQRQSKILESEGKRQSQINFAEGEKQLVVLQSEAAQIDQQNRASGEAAAITMIAQATAQSIEVIGKSLASSGGEQAASLKIAESYVEAFRELAQKGTTVIVPANANDASSMVTQALTIFDAVKKRGS